MCDVRLVATDRNHQLLAFMLSMGPGQPHTSENYRWFEERGVRHQYIDRIVVSPLAKGTGIGRALYESVFERARERGASEVTAEVNIRPVNPGSIAFHERLGFRQLAEQDTRGGTVRVSPLLCPGPSTRPRYADSEQVRSQRSRSRCPRMCLRVSRSSRNTRASIAVVTG